LVPILEIFSLMLFLEPSPMASIVITEPTPMMMPSIVSIALVLLSKRARHAILKRFCIFIILISELEN